MKKILLGALAALIVSSGIVLAQPIPVPQVSRINPNDLMQVLPGGQPQAQSQYATPAQITSQLGYVKASPLTGFTYTFGNSQSDLVLTHPSTIAAGTVVFASAPSDGAKECVFAQNTVTTLTLSAPGQTINNAVTTIAALARVCYLFSISNLTWDRD